MGLLPMNIDLLPPSDDRIFKLLMTSPDAKPALIDLISATLRRPVLDAVVRNNELPNKDERERAVYRSRRMYQTDMQSNIATAEDRGRQDGEQIGEQRKAFAIARNLLGMNMPLDQIVTVTGLTREEVESLDV